MGGAVAQTYPDQLDILRGFDTTPQIELVLDTSGSMGDTMEAVCNFYRNTELADPSDDMSRLDLVKAVLTGCETADDGLLDTWAESVVFAVREFGSNNTMNPADAAPRIDVRYQFGESGLTDAEGIPIGSRLNVVEDAVLGLYSQGWTPLAAAYAAAGRHFATSFDNGNSRHCRQNFIVAMTDGDGNVSTTANPAIIDFVVDQPDLTFSDTNGCYTAGGCSNYQAPFADSAARHMVRDSGGAIVDALPLVDDTELASGDTRGQPIRTYTIGFDPPGDSTFILADMAIQGEGLYYEADNYEQLATAFNNIIAEIVPRTQVAFSPGTVQSEGMFSGNFLYAPTFAPTARGNWFGTVKKHCVVPASETDLTCLFRKVGEELFINDAPVDLWTGNNELEVTTGGTGLKMFTDLFGVGGPSDPVPSNPYSYRNIVTWRPGSNGYFPVDGSPSFLNEDTRTSDRCEHFRLINKLHGFTHQVADCEGGDYSPVGFNTWAQGDSPNGSTILLKYSDECESSTSSCFVMTNSNDGMLHAFRARDGWELSAVIPGELWGTDDVAHNRLRDVMEQPTLESLKNYYFDGSMRLFHDDQNANGYIDGTEKAYLIAGLGRGGRAYYLWDVTNFNGDFASPSAPAPRPLMVDEATGFKHLRETWAAPWLGLMRMGANFHPVGVFASGHQRQLDRDTAAFATLERGLEPATTDSESSPYSQSCTDFGLDAVLCEPEIPPTGCFACDNASPSAGGCPPVAPPATMYCYDWPGWAGTSSAAPFDNGQPGGHNITFGPFVWSTPLQEAEAYRVVFSRFELQANDYLEFLDANQGLIGRLEANGIGDTCAGASVCSPWIYSSEFYVRLVSDGVDTSNVTGWDVQSVDVIRRNRHTAARDANSSQPLPSDLTRPTVYFVNLDSWANLPAFGERPVGADNRQADALMVRVTSDCETVEPGEICIDADDQPDLANFYCPVSTEISVYTEGNVFRTAYFGTECGGIWKIDQHPNPAVGWTVQRILRLNRADSSGRIIHNQRSQDYRKIFTRLELVLSRCNGARSIGVYFGSGNLQRPASENQLQDQNITRFSNTGQGPFDGDVIGVVWDSEVLPRPPTGLSLEDLENVTDVTEVADTTAGNGANGFFIELPAHEKMVRNPVVFDGIATFKTYHPVAQATECVSALGAETIYQFDNCNAAPFVDTYDSGTVVGDNTSDRITWRGETDIGGGLLVYTPASGKPFLSPPDTDPATRADLPSRPNRRAMRVYLWRTFVDG